MSEPKPPQPGRKQMEPLPVSEKNKKLKDMFTRLLGSYDHENAQQIQEEIVTRVRYLRAKYPDWVNREVVHIISGSGMRVGSEIVTDDFTGDDCVETFLESLIRKYGH